MFTGFCFTRFDGLGTEETGKGVYLIVDGATISASRHGQGLHFTEWQERLESVRKDIECGVFVTLLSFFMTPVTSRCSRPIPQGPSEQHIFDLLRAPQPASCLGPARAVGKWNGVGRCRRPVRRRLRRELLQADDSCVLGDW